MTGAGRVWRKAVDSANGAIVGVIGVYRPDVEMESAGPDRNQGVVPLPDFVEEKEYHEFLQTMVDVTKDLLGEGKDHWCKFALSLAKCKLRISQICNPWLCTPATKAVALQKCCSTLASREQSKLERTSI